MNNRGRATSVVVSIFDSATQMYSKPMFVPSAAYAIRSFKDEVNRADGNNQLNAHPEDFELRMLSTFDEDTGIFTTTGMQVLARGKDVIAPAS